MEKIKSPSVAGMFYPNTDSDIKNQIKYFSEKNKNYYEVSTRAVIVPHAGWVYSGRLAYEGISQLDKNLKNIFVIAPAHRVPFEGIALLDCEKYEIPTGLISINQTINNELNENFGKFYNDAFKEEHAIEVLLPFIQSVFDEVNIIPVLVGKTSFSSVEDIIKKYYDDKTVGFVISSDLSHYLSDANAKKLDITTATMIETGDINNFQFEQACNAVGIMGLVQFANKKQYSLIRIDMENSAASSKDKSRVVGYGSWFLYEGTVHEFLKKYYSDFIINLVKIVINSTLDRTNVTINYAQVLDEFGACFVTLEKNNQLRGCIGSILAHRPLINDIIEHSKNAAFNDQRFAPVTKNEVKDLKVSVSILTKPERIDFSDEEDLLEKIQKDNDGIIIKDGNYQSVYLPSVWELIQDKREFLNSLKVKAGLSPNYFSSTFEAYKFETVYIKES